MDTALLKKYVNVKNIIQDFTSLEFTAMSRHKLAGKKGEKEIDFTPEEKKEILKGLKELVKELEKS